jgi:hypothetical protein
MIGMLLFDDTLSLCHVTRSFFAGLWLRADAKTAWTGG